MNLHSPCIIKVPFYYDGYTNYNRPGFDFSACDSIDLNQLHVMFPIDNYTKGELVFANPLNQGKMSTIALTCSLSLIGGRDQCGVVAAQHNIDGVVGLSRHVFEIGNFGNQMTDLALVNVKARFGWSSYSFGLTPRKFNIVYHGQKLHGSCYCLLVGPWCVLLDDELHFDSVALLYATGLETDRIDIGEFIYTVNPYIMKARMLK